MKFRGWEVGEEWMMTDFSGVNLAGKGVIFWFLIRFFGQINKFYVEFLNRYAARSIYS